MKTNTLIKRIATLVGFSLGAFVLTAVAASWTPPLGVAPTNNVEAPINESTNLQSKKGRLRLNTAVPGDMFGLDVFGVSRFFGNIEIGATSSPATIKIIDGNQANGKVLTSNSAGVATWQSVPGSASGDMCEPLAEATTPMTGNQIVFVPGDCINHTCNLSMAIYDSGGALSDIFSTSLTQFSDTASNPKGELSNWWSKTGGSHDGTTCNSGRNGSTLGCDGLLAYNNDAVKLYDDLNAVENNTGWWTLHKSSNNVSVKVYACR